jgi:hypothetical protein
MDLDEASAFDFDTIRAVAPDGDSMTFLHPWGGCEECSALILRNDRDGLLRRAVDIARQHGESESQAQSVKGPHDAFWLGYTGRYEPIATTVAAAVTQRISERRKGDAFGSDFTF